MVKLDTALGLDGEPDVAALIEEAVAFTASQGVLIAEDAGYTHAPVSLLPNDFPLDQYIRAVELAPLFNMLIERVAADGPWMLEVLESVLPHDDFTRKLVEIYQMVDGKGLASQGVHLGINRSDYMLHGESLETSEILQVEINTIASSFGCLSSKISAFHRYMVSKVLQRPLERASGGPSYILPSNCVIEGLTRGLCMAHKEYVRQRGIEKGAAVVMMVVQPNERNIMDQKMLEVALWQRHGVRLVRATLRQVCQSGSLADEKRQGQGPVLRLTRHSRDDKDEQEVLEVSVAYFRAGYTPADYPGPLEWDGRVLIERSMAIKCPCISYHLAGTKKVQEALSRPGVLERFVPSTADAVLLRSCFAGLFGLEEGNVEGALAVKMALERPQEFVLKPQREGGGNNLYGEEMVQALRTMTPNQLAAYILMEKIKPPEQRALLVRNGELVEGGCVYELGIYGVFLGGGGGGCRAPLLNQAFGHLLRTKLSSSNEGGVAAGFAVLSSPLLVGDLQTARLHLLPQPSEDDDLLQRRPRHHWWWSQPALQAAVVGSAVLLGLGLLLTASSSSPSSSSSPARRTTGMFRDSSIRAASPS